MIEDIIGWGLIVLIFLGSLYLIYFIYSRYRSYQERQTQYLAYKQKLKEEYLLNQRSVWLDEEEKKSQIISTDKFKNMR